MISIFLFEVLGTSIFTGATLMIPQNSIETLMFMCMIYFCALLICTPISGGHFNPAYTLSVFCLSRNKQEKWPKMVTMILAQFVGGGVGLLFAMMVRK